MIVHPIGSAPCMEDVLLWDAEERCWRVGHGRKVFPEFGETFWCDCSVEEGSELILDGDPVPVFTRVTHWATLPAPVDD